MIYHLNFFAFNNKYAQGATICEPELDDILYILEIKREIANQCDTRMQLSFKAFQTKDFSKVDALRENTLQFWNDAIFYMKKFPDPKRRLRLIKYMDMNINELGLEYQKKLNRK